MRIVVEFYRADYASVMFVPSIVERILGKRTEERHALRGAGALWQWDAAGQFVGDRVQRALERAWCRAGRPSSVVKATAPPS